MSLTSLLFRSFLHMQSAFPVRLANLPRHDGRGCHLSEALLYSNARRKNLIPGFPGTQQEKTLFPISMHGNHGTFALRKRHATTLKPMTPGRPAHPGLSIELIAIPKALADGESRHAYKVLYSACGNQSWYLRRVLGDMQARPGSRLSTACRGSRR